ncbi:MAG: hypothetical protein LN414_01700, partial [Candidatus Thermoplasmatota archaeon]|nr:hypothetical protein [Candidatus Thermoplasmatota archaeon]
QEQLVVRVESVLDPPRVLTIGGVSPVDGRFQLEATQGTESVYLVVVEDVDSDRFRFRHDAKFTTFDVVSGNGTIIFTPNNAEVGSRTFNLSVEDWEFNSVVVPVDIRVVNVNDPPGIVYINQPKNAMTFEHDATVLMQGTCEDPDERHDQVLTFTWISSIDGEVARGTNAQVEDLSPGDHQLTLRVSDGESVNDKTILIRVKAPPEGPGNGGPDDPDDPDNPFMPTTTGGGLMFLILAVLLGLIVATIVLVRGRSKRRGRTPGTEAAGEEEVEIKMVDGIPMAMLGDEVTPENEPGAGTEMMSILLGRSAKPSGPQEDIPVSPWSPQDLEIAKRPMPTAPPPPPPPPPPQAQAKVSFDAADWEEEPEVTVVPPVQPPPVPPVPAVAPSPPPPPPGVPQQARPPQKRPPSDSGWEEVE